MERKALTIDYDALEKLLKQPPTEADKKEHLRDFVEIVLRLKKNADLKQYFEHHGESYVSGILIIKTEIDETDCEKLDPLRTLNRSTGEKVDVECQHINSPVDMNKSTLEKPLRSSTIGSMSAGSTAYTTTTEIAIHR